MALFRSSAAIANMLANTSAVPQAGRYLLAAAYHSSKMTAAAGNQSSDPLGINQKEGRVAGAFDDDRHEGDTYYATPSYPNTTPDQSNPTAASSSSSRNAGGHPRGPADVSSMNDPSGKGREPEGNDHVHYPGRPDAVPGGGSSSSNASRDSFKGETPTRSSMETFPGTTFEQGMTQPSGLKGSRGFSSSSSSVIRTFETLTRKFKMNLFADSSSSSGLMMSHGDESFCGNGIAAAVKRFSSGSFAGEGAGGDSSSSRSSEIPVPDHSWSEADSSSNKDPKSADATLNTVEGSTGSPISGAWRAMTADFAAGGDDMTGGGSAGTVADDMGMKINAESGLPQMKDVDDAGAHSAGFGAQRDPQAASDETYTARQTEKSTGQMPAEAGSS